MTNYLFEGRREEGGRNEGRKEGEGMDEKLTARQESSISIAAHSENHSAKTEIGAVWLPPAFIGKIGAVETLDFKGAVEE